MVHASLDSLTDRQLAVLERIDRRSSYKEIAHELDISESRVSQYATILKNKFNVNSLGELTEAYRACLKDFGAPCNLDPSQNTNLPTEADVCQQAIRADQPRYEFSDSFDSEWANQFEQQVVPGAFDGKDGTLLRIGLVAIVAMSFLAAIVLGLTVMHTLTEYVTSGS